MKLMLLLVPVLAAAQTVTYDRAIPQLRFAATELESALKAGGPALRVALQVSGKGVPQSYSIRRTGAVCTVSGADANGAMYGGLELAELIHTGTAVKDADSAPHIAQRGIKFNAPLDARTPSYSDNSDSAQNNIPEMWSADFWHEFLDEMARHRYNVLSLWSLHPFPSIVRVPEYPDVALDDVKRTTVALDDSYSHTGNDMVRPSHLEKLETVKRMTMDQKIAFWREMMQYAKDRGIAVYWFTWNIFTWGAEGKYGITKDQTNTTTIDYFRKSVRETVLTYPLLAGMGITAGEQMQNRRDEFSKEKWLWKTYGEGLRDALQKQPGREFRLIHRYHQTGQNEIVSEFREYPGPFDLSFKYAIAHMYSSPKPVFLDPALPHLSPKLRTWLTVRNDDIYSFRWGDASYAREFIRNIPGPDKIAGFYMGPDGYNWGREFLSTEPDSPRQLVMKKQWYSFLLWGRLAYDPGLPDSRLQSIVAKRFPEVPAGKLLAAWSRASKVFPEITRFSWGDIDLRWFPEASISHKKHLGFYTVRHFIEGVTMPGGGDLDILTWRERLLAKQPMQGKTPLEVAADLKAWGTIPELSALRQSQGSNKELRLTLGDIEAMAHLSNYYAEKILGAADLALFDKSGQAEQQASAIQHLTAASGHWKQYAAVYSKQYKPQLLNRVGFIDIPALQTNVDADIEIARKWRSGTIKDTGGKPRGADNPFRL